VAALEAMMALRALAGDRVNVTLLAPQREFHHRPMAVAEPFAIAAARPGSATSCRGGCTRPGSSSAARRRPSSYTELKLRPSGVRVRPGRVVALALLEGPRIAGLPSDAQGFIPVTELGELRGLDGVYAAGDATAYPIKHGGVAAQQADVVAAAIAARAGLTGDPQPLRPVIHGALLMGLGTRYLEATPIGDGLRFDRQRRRPIGSAHEDRRSPPRALPRDLRPGSLDPGLLLHLLASGI